jgi:hypothetical protein
MLMTPILLLARLHREGLHLEAGDDQRLYVGPRARLTSELRSLIAGHKVGLLDLVQHKPSREELSLLVDVLDLFEVEDIKVRPAGSRTLGAYSRCSRHPVVGTWVYYGGVAVCKRCELGIAPEPDAEPRLSEWFIKLCRARGLQTASIPPPPRIETPLIEQVQACLSNGPKPLSAIALELEVSKADLRRLLGADFPDDDKTKVRPMAFPERDPYEQEQERAKGDDQRPMWMIRQEEQDEDLP